MAEELKSEIGKLENLIGCQKADITSKDSIEELIEALNSKYKSDIHSSIRLHRLEFYQALIEDARLKKKKSVEVEETFLLAKDDTDAKEEAKTVELGDLERPTEVVSVPPEDIDEWKNLMTLSKIYYVMDHPTSKGLTWERRVHKKKHISKFTDKDLIEWRVSQNFRLKALEEWALSRSEARKLAEESPYDFDDLLDDDESRQLEDMFNILDTQKQSKKEVGDLEKELHTKRPFKFKDERKEDWTESYSDDSEQSGDEAEDRFCETFETEEEPDFEIEDLNYQEAIGEQMRRDQEEFIPTQMFSPYKEIPKYRRKIFEIMEKTEDMTEWYDHCHKAIGEGREFKIEPHPPTIRIASPENEIEPLNLESGAKRSVEKVIKTSLENIGEENYEKSAHDDEDKGYETSMYDEEGHERPIHGEKDSESIALDDDKKPIHDKEDLYSESQVSKNTTEPESEDFMGKHGASEIGSNIKSIISKARSSVSDIVEEKYSEEDTTKDSGRPVEDLESVLRIESMSKGRINVRGRKSSSQKDMVEGKVKSMIFMAKNSLSGKLNESFTNKEKESVVKDGIQTIISEANSSAENLAQVASPESILTDSLEYMLRQESVSKTKIDKTNAK